MTTTFVSSFAPCTTVLRSRIGCERTRNNEVRYRSCVRMAAPVLVSAETFESEVLQSELPCLVDFYAEWCGPCKLVAPLMDWAAKEYDGKMKVAKVDTEGASNLVKEYRINGLPTLAVFKSGQAYAVQEGAVGKKGLIKYIEDNVFE